MYKYYFKIKKDELEFEFSTDNLDFFNEKSEYYLKKIFEQKEEKNNNNDINIEENIQLENNHFETSFEKKLEEAMENPKTQVVEKQFEEDTFKTFYFEKNPQSNLKRFILCAYYLQTIEKLGSFTLKQINNKIYPLTKFPIDHPVLEEAMACGYIKLEENENILKHYILTSEGVGYYENEFQT